MNEEIKAEIVSAVARKFRCMGKGSLASSGNPIAAVLANEPPQFALGVDVGDVVEFVVSEYYSSCKIRM